MNEQMLARLVAAIERDPRTANKLSTDAKLGRNYVRSILEEGKSPKAETLMKLLDALGSNATIYVLTGREVSSEDFEFLELLSNLSPDAKHKAIELFQSLLAHEE